MKSYEDDQKAFIRALKEILQKEYYKAVYEARNAKLAYLDGIENPSARDINQATAIGNRVMANAAKNAGVPSVPQYIKDKKAATKEKIIEQNRARARHAKAANNLDHVTATPGNFQSRKQPVVQGYSLVDSMEQTFNEARR